jgi:hypothetical protein
VFKFDVFGTTMSVLKKNGEWLLFKESLTSMRCRVYDVIIPAELEDSELEKYLDDIYHEYANDRHPKVIRVIEK